MVCFAVLRLPVLMVIADMFACVGVALCCVDPCISMTFAFVAVLLLVAFGGFDCLLCCGFGLCGYVLIMSFLTVSFVLWLLLSYIY